MTATVGPWTCDSCGKPIAKLEDGWLEWLTAPDGHCHGLRLVHHMEIGRPQGFRCSYFGPKELARSGSDLEDLPLCEFLGPDGLSELISMMQEPRFATSGIAEIVRRLQIPGHEEARHHVGEAVAAGYLPPPSTAGNYSQQDIEAVQAYLKAHPDRAVISSKQAKGLATSASPRPPRIEAWWKDNGPNATPRYSGEVRNRFGNILLP